jgi:hypothetical protein
MPYFVLEYRYADLDARARAREDHLAYMRRLHDEGTVVLAGPVGDGGGAMVVLRVDDEAQVWRLVEDDPYTRAGASGDVTVRPWRVVVPDGA